MTKPPLNLDDFNADIKLGRKPLSAPNSEDVKTVFERPRLLDSATNSNQKSEDPVEYSQLGLRAPKIDVDQFKQQAKLSRMSQPQFLRVLLKAYNTHAHKLDIEEEVIRDWR